MAVVQAPRAYTHMFCGIKQCCCTSAVPIAPWLLISQVQPTLAALALSAVSFDITAACPAPPSILDAPEPEWSQSGSGFWYCRRSDSLSDSLKICPASLCPGRYWMSEYCFWFLYCRCSERTYNSSSFDPWNHKATFQSTTKKGLWKGWKEGRIPFIYRYPRKARNRKSSTGAVQMKKPSLKKKISWLFWGQFSGLMVGVS